MKILDAGCGAGLLAKKLAQFGEVVGVDHSSEAIKFCQKRGVKVIQASINKLPFKSNSFDLITCIDVIYHKNVDDQQALSQLFRVLKPGGILILRAAAVKWLRSSHDEYVHTRHRYSKDELSEKLTSAGFTIQKISYMNFLLFFPTVISFIFFKLKPPVKISSTISKTPFFNRILTSYLNLENLLLNFFDLPIGLGIIVVAAKSQ